MAQLLMESKEEVDEIVAGVVKVVESDCSISVVSRSSTPLPDEIDEIIVTYWPMRGPAAGAVFLMLDYAKIPYVRKTSYHDLAKVCSNFGGPFDTFAPPVVQYGSLLYSQPIVVILWAARRAGLTPHSADDELKAIQYIADLIDIFEVEIGRLISNMNKGGKVFKEQAFNILPKLMRTLERGIKGPFWYGDKPTFVDFFATNIFDFYCVCFFNRLESEFGVNLFIANDKFLGVVDAIRSLDSYKANTIPICREDFVANDSAYLSWKN
jgi:hypothetical protein